MQEPRAIAPIPNDVNQFINENDQVEFVKAFHNFIRLLNVGKSFTEFGFPIINKFDHAMRDFEKE